MSERAVKFTRTQKRLIQKTLFGSSFFHYTVFVETVIAEFDFLTGKEGSRSLLINIAVAHFDPFSL